MNFDLNFLMLTINYSIQFEHVTCFLFALSSSDLLFKKTQRHSWVRKRTKTTYLSLRDSISFKTIFFIVEDISFALKEHNVRKLINEKYHYNVVYNFHWKMLSWDIWLCIEWINSSNHKTRNQMEYSWIYLEFERVHDVIFLCLITIAL
jgi:hypothetical protein